MTAILAQVNWEQVGLFATVLIMALGGQREYMTAYDRAIGMAMKNVQKRTLK